jgi:hypothetical protein
MPGEDGVGLDDTGYFLQCLFAELHTDFGQGFALAVTQPDAAFDLAAQEAIFCHQVLVAQQEFLIH